MLQASINNGKSDAALIIYCSWNYQSGVQHWYCLLVWKPPKKRTSNLLYEITWVWLRHFLLKQEPQRQWKRQQSHIKRWQIQQIHLSGQNLLNSCNPTERNEVTSFRISAHSVFSPGYESDSDMSWISGGEQCDELVTSSLFTWNLHTLPRARGHPSSYSPDNNVLVYIFEVDAD